MVDPTARVTRQGQTLTARNWAMLEAAYRAAGLNPTEHLYVTKGSWKLTTASSGSTHNGSGAADLRVWILPGWAQANLCERLVTELRRRGGVAWYRDADHGGFDPHIHVILRDEPGLSSSAAWQVREYDAGRNGLTDGGRDYHPRPSWSPFAMTKPLPADLHRVTVTGVSVVGFASAVRQSGMSRLRFLRWNGTRTLAGIKPGFVLVVPKTCTAVYAGPRR